ncbi:LysR family transcriptional regulator [Marinilactibacillus kalidii]|uniref:LysR family transcriptional regulator n=1 Tax=Marinilactibacillus kalidii TaxID=2820274 RepID=UPI001ABE4AAF|nr:LysR family transcriptional regulator [Marinilactibacillus kalidii]
MNLKQLEYFLTIVEEGQITAAAKKLHIAQPPLSYQLRLLEEDLGVQLMKRGSRKITLTPAGELLKQRAEQIFSLTTATNREMELFKKGNAGTLSIGTISSSSTIIPDQSILDFAGKYPNVQFDIHEGNSYEVIEMLEKGVIDVGIVRTPFKKVGLTIRYAKTEPIVAVFPTGKNYGKSKRSIELIELYEQPLIIYRRFAELINIAFEKEQITPSIRCRNDDARTTLNWTRAGFGVGIVPLSALTEQDRKELIYKEVNVEELHTQMAVISKNDRQYTPLVMEFIETFAKSIESL